jgi:Alpha-L-fucosidase C-terminal domain
MGRTETRPVVAITLLAQPHLVPMDSWDRWRLRTMQPSTPVLRRHAGRLLSALATAALALALALLRPSTLHAQAKASADGTIPELVQQILLGVGSWLKVNGEAIYGTRPCKIYGEGPTMIVPGPLHDADTQSFTAKDFRFTCKENILYAVEMAQPSPGEAVIHSFGSGIQGDQNINSIAMLVSEDQLKFRRQSDGLHIQLPRQPAGKYAYVFRIALGTNTNSQKPAR